MFGQPLVSAKTLTSLPLQESLVDDNHDGIFGPYTGDRRGLLLQVDRQEVPSDSVSFGFPRSNFRKKKDETKLGM